MFYKIQNHVDITSYFNIDWFKIRALSKNAICIFFSKNQKNSETNFEKKMFAKLLMYVIHKCNWSHVCNFLKANSFFSNNFFATFSDFWNTYHSKSNFYLHSICLEKSKATTIRNCTFSSKLSHTITFFTFYKARINQ